MNLLFKMQTLMIYGKQEQLKKKKRILAFKVQLQNQKITERVCSFCTSCEFRGFFFLKILSHLFVISCRVKMTSKQINPPMKWSESLCPTSECAEQDGDVEPDGEEDFYRWKKRNDKKTDSFIYELKNVKAKGWEMKPFRHDWEFESQSRNKRYK